MSERNAPASGARAVLGIVTVCALVLVVGSTAGVAAAAVGGGVDAAGAPVADHTAQQTASNGTERFSLDAEVVENCGIRCRTVTANLTNTGDNAENVTTNTEIGAGGAVILERVDQVGNVSSNESVQRTANLSIGPMEALSILRNGGRIQIETTVAWDGGSQNFTERRGVV